ncbi:hypothetical protein A8708_26555 [Paenibacillus oryzisoli]|uniref:Uncharacterized protein n=1 Tax=Paenibacillus oryzisoli TaxID=1850517 RepID=A0A198ACQ0_9BACL|nr:hypothetical protein A8708_26555 [Paenibacillus oryzisoli]
MKPKYLYFPIRFKWRTKKQTGLVNRWFTTHGWQIFGDLFGWTLSIGALKICFGWTRDEVSK